MLNKFLDDFKTRVKQIIQDYKKLSVHNFFIKKCFTKLINEINKILSYKKNLIRIEFYVKIFFNFY